MLSGVSSQSVSDVFNANYVNYRIMFNFTTSASSIEPTMRMRVSGTDNSSANYIWHKMTAGHTGAYAGQGSGNSALATSWNFYSASGTYEGAASMDLQNPFASIPTNFSCLGAYYDSLPNHGSTYASGLMSVNTSYTGFSFFVSTGTMTGTVRVYGYNN